MGERRSAGRPAEGGLSVDRRLARFHLAGALPLLAATVVLLAPDAGHAKPFERVELLLQPVESSRSPSAPFDATVTVRLAVAATTLRLVVEGEGVFSEHTEREVRRGSWLPGEAVDFTIRTVAEGLGEGTLRVSAQVLDEQGEIRAGRRRDLHVLYEADRVWWSDSSPTDLRLRRAHELEASGAADPLVEDAVSTATHTSSRALGLRLRSATGFPKSADEEVSLTVSGTVRWTDRNGEAHPVPLAEVQVLDADLLVDDVIAEARTNSQGQYSVTFTYDDGVGEGHPDIFVRAFARSLVADVRPDDDLFDPTYELESDVMDEVSGDLLVHLTANNQEDAATAFSVHSALVMIGNYAATLNDVVPSQIVVRFPTTRHTSVFSRSDRELHILRLDRWDWDVIHHEYGHYFQAIHGLSNSPGGAHSSGVNNATVLGKDGGIRIAWGEGWPTFFGIAGQVRSGAAALGIPNVGDESYQDTEDMENPAVSLESSTGVGEDDELSVMAALWDLFDENEDGEDRVSIDDRALFQSFDVFTPVTIGQAWDALAVGQLPEERTEIGAVLAQAEIAPNPILPPDELDFATSFGPLQFRWERNGGGTPNPLDDFSLVFYAGNLLTEILRKDSLTSRSYEPDAFEWAQLVDAGVVHWVVEGKNTSTPETPGGVVGSYWSGARLLGGADVILVLDESASMEEEFGVLKPAWIEALTQVETSLAGASPPVIQLITFTDEVVVRTTTTDFDEARQAVLDLSAEGGGPCPENSLHALRLAAHNLSPGGGVIFASDASSNPGASFDEITDEIVAKGGIVFSLLSGSCPTTDGGSSALAKGETTQGRSGSEAPLASEAKPGGGTDPSDGPLIVDEGQDPVDEHGDSAQTASRLLVGGSPVRGLLTDEEGDVGDFFVFSVEAGVPYAIRTVSDVGFTVFHLLEADGETELSFWRQYNPDGFLAGDVREIPLIPVESGDLYLRVEGALFGAEVYRVSVRESSLAEPFGSFASLAALTGGEAVLPNEFGALDSEQLQLAMVNGVSAAVRPSVVSVNPQLVPRHFFQTPSEGMELTLTLRGHDTHWDDTSSVEFPEGDIVVLETDVPDAETIRVRVRVDPDAALGRRDVVVTTSQGEANERAEGFDVIEIEGEAFFTILSFDPPRIAQGAMQTAVIEGSRLNWSSMVDVDLGEGVDVLAVRQLGPDRLEVDLFARDNARLGFRTLTVDDPPNYSQSKLDRATFVVYAPEPGILASGIAAGLTVLRLTRRRRVEPGTPSLGTRRTKKRVIEVRSGPRSDDSPENPGFGGS
jgi:hypothetical protein